MVIDIKSSVVSSPVLGDLFKAADRCVLEEQRTEAPEWWDLVQYAASEPSD